MLAQRAATNRLKCAGLTMTLPLAAYSFPDTGGPVSFASTWGAGPEKIALLTGALAIRLPLFKLQHRTRGQGAAMVASWNSQFWTRDTISHMTAIDTGYGLGFNFSLGGMYPVYTGNSIDHFEFIDGGGVIHRLSHHTWGGVDYPAGIYKSQDSSYLVWNYNAVPYPTLTFTDGTVWTFRLRQ